MLQQEAVWRCSAMLILKDWMARHWLVIGAIRILQIKLGFDATFSLDPFHDFDETKAKW